MDKKLEAENMFKHKRIPNWLEHIGHHYDDDLRHITMEMLHTETKDIIDNSCFYYCSGSDITPIIAFEGFIHSFVYSDNCVHQNYDEALFKLKNKLRNENYIEIQKINIDLSFFRLHKFDLATIRIPNYSRIVKPLPSGEFSVWRKEKKYVSLLYLCWDDICVWKNLYERNNIYPIAICNWRPESSNMYNIDNFFVWNEANLPQYVIGHANHLDEIKYKEVGKVKYFGDYFNENTLYLPLFEKTNDNNMKTKNKRANR